MKDRTFAFRISEQDYRLLRSKAARGKITMTDLILRSVKDKEIVVVQGLPEAMAEMKALEDLLFRQAQQYQSGLLKKLAFWLEAGVMFLAALLISLLIFLR